MFRGVAAVLALAGLLRLASAIVLVPAWEARSRRASFPDQYPTLAASLVDRHTLGYAPIAAPITTVRGPGFPGWLAIPMALGVRADRVIAWWATIPGLLGGALAAWIALRWAPSALAARLAACAAALAALHPLPVFTSSRAMSDEFCGVLALAGLASWQRAESSPRQAPLWIALAGLALGTAMLTRATGVLFVVSVVLAAFVGRAPVRRALLVAAVSLLPPLAWSVRSSALEGRPVFVHSLGVYNFWLGEALHRGPPADQHQIRERARSLMAAAAPGAEVGLWYADLTPEQTAHLERALAPAALRRIAQDPAGYAWRVLAGLGWFWVRADTWKTTRLYAALAVPFVLLTLLGARAWRRGPHDVMGLALLLGIVLHVLFYATVYPMARYSVTVYPWCAPLAALGLARLRYSGGSGGQTSP